MAAEWREIYEAQVVVGLMICPPADFDSIPAGSLLCAGHWPGKPLRESDAFPQGATVSIKIELPDQRRDVVSERVVIVAAGGLIGTAVTAPIESDATESLS